MKTLVLVRHAKSSWSDPSLEDKDRPLNERGKRDAPAMGKRLADAGVKPDLILSSSARRARKISGLDAYFVSDKMFACISGKGVGLRLPVAVATELQFARENVVPFNPGGVTSTREWIQIDRADAADYEKDLALFQASVDFVKAARSR